MGKILHRSRKPIDLNLKLSGSFALKSHRARSSLCLCVSVVNKFLSKTNHRDTEAQRNQLANRLLGQLYPAKKVFSAGSCAYRSGSSFLSSSAASRAADDAGKGRLSGPLALRDASTRLNRRSAASFFFPRFS